MWVIDEPLFMHKDSTRGYTPDPYLAMRSNVDPGEAVDPAEIDDLMHSQVARERYRFEHEYELTRRRNIDRSSRLRAVQTEALKAGVDLAHILGAVDAKLDEAARILQRRRIAA